MYEYRKLSPEQKTEVVKYRQLNCRPWHSPPHWKFSGKHQFIITASCYEHKHIVGKDPNRMSDFENILLSVTEKFVDVIYAWCILPNHYHLLIKTSEIENYRKQLGLLHGKTSYNWNIEDQQRGRKVWHNCVEREIKSHRHFWASINYIHNNPVKHGYVNKWQEWIWSSGSAFLERVGIETAKKIWKEFPVLDYGKNWDVD